VAQHGGDREVDRADGCTSGAYGLAEFGLRRQGVPQPKGRRILRKSTNAVDLRLARCGAFADAVAAASRAPPGVRAACAARTGVPDRSGSCPLL
jgi:hypothetical protein